MIKNFFEKVSWSPALLIVSVLLLVSSILNSCKLG